MGVGLAGDKLEEANVVPNDDFTVNVSGRCPHCSEIISFTRQMFVFKIMKRPCPMCKRDVTVTPIEYCDSNKLSINTETLIAGKGAAVWAINLSNFYWLLKLIPVLKTDNVRFINKDVIKVLKTVRRANDFMNKEIAVKTLGGKKVFTPDIIRIENILTVIVPNNLNVFNDIKKQIAAEYLHVIRIVHITELF